MTKNHKPIGGGHPNITPKEYDCLMQACGVLVGDNSIMIDIKICRKMLELEKRIAQLEVKE